MKARLEGERVETGVRWWGSGIKDVQEEGDFLGGKINRTWWPWDAEWEVSLSRGGCPSSWIGCVGGRAEISEEGDAGGSSKRKEDRGDAGALLRRGDPRACQLQLQIPRGHGEGWRELRLEIQTQEILTRVNAWLSLRSPANTEDWGIWTGLGHLPFGVCQTPCSQRSPLFFLHPYCTVSRSQYLASSRCTNIVIECMTGYMDQSLRNDKMHSG